MKPPNKGHVVDNINSAILSSVERLSSFRGSQCIEPIERVIFGTLSGVLCREVFVQCPYLGGSTTRRSTVYTLYVHTHTLHHRCIIYTMYPKNNTTLMALSVAVYSDSVYM